MEISVLACTDKGGESMSRIQREECLQLHNAPKKKKICEALPFLLLSSSSSFLFFSVYYSTISRHQLRSEGYIPNSPGSVVRCHAKKKKIRVHARYPWKEKQLGGKEKRKTHTHQRCPPPPETFLPVTKFLPGRRTCPRVPEQRTCQLKRGKFCSR